MTALLALATGLAALLVSALGGWPLTAAVLSAVVVLGFGFIVREPRSGRLYALGQTFFRCPSQCRDRCDGVCGCLEHLD